ncbi:MAG: hypothetical protein CM1200mP14_11050 [Gammaproteobacteria bacterium]|nr:MAG: hypothetical protein CM1200mP14_11050 [Gammaproteobacteria bacterium]
MSDLKTWISQRRPVSPLELGSWIDARELLCVCFRPHENRLRSLGQARLSPGRVRNSAFQLLTADALLTYACELALDTEDPDLVLGVIMQDSAASS